MNLLSEIEGLSGENLTTAVLRLLLLRSQEIREVFVRLVSDHSRVGPLTVDSHFSCVLEHSTEDAGSNRWGRLDLLLETSDAVIGLENKLFAEFQEGQPHKYLESVRGHADQLSTIRCRRTPLRHVVAVMAPKSRSKEVDDRIGDNPNLLRISWEQVREALNPLVDVLDRDTSVLLRSLDSFLKDRLVFLPRFDEWTPHLQRSFDPGEGSPQRDVVRKLWGLFPYAGRRLSSGKRWLGYYFPSGFKNITGWFGFIPGQDIIEGTKNAAELIVVTSFQMNLPAPPFRPVRLSNSNFLGKSTTVLAWAVDYDKTWSTLEKWREELTPIRQQIEQLAKDAPPSEEAG